MDKLSLIWSQRWWDGRRFAGVFAQDRMLEGEFEWPSGAKYSGSFKNDMRHGHGTYTWANGRQSYVGEWVNDHMTGSIASKSCMHRKCPC